VDAAGPEFLSPEWLAELGHAVSSAVPEGAEPLRLGIVVTGAAAVPGASSGGDVSYTLVLGGPAGSSVVAGVAEAEVVMVESYEDARALASGSVSASALLEGGRIKLRGDARRLVAAGDTLRAVGEAFGTVPRPS